MTAARADDFLHGAGRFAPGAATRASRATLLALIVACGPVYGAAMGSFGWESARWLQMIFAALKVPLLLLATWGLCLPGFFVLNTIVGLRADWPDALQALLAGQAALSLALAALSPLTLLWYASGTDYRAALLFNAGVFGVATVAGQLALRREYRALIVRHTWHRWMLVVWAVMYAFVGIEMGWMLRPFIGDPELPVSFFRPEPFSNAYIVIWRLIRPL